MRAKYKLGNPAVYIKLNALSLVDNAFAILRALDKLGYLLFVHTGSNCQVNFKATWNLYRNKNS